MFPGRCVSFRFPDRSRDTKFLGGKKPHLIERFVLATATQQISRRESMRSNARTVSDSMGEERLIKGGVSGRRRTARDDVGVAIVAAVSEGARMPAQAPRRRRSWKVA